MGNTVSRKRLFTLINQNWIMYGFFVFWIVYFFAFWSRVISLDDAGNLMMGHINLWGDWAVHFTMGSSMAYRQLILTESPLLYGAPFGYPFFANLLSAVLVRLSIPFFAAFVLPSFLFSVLLVFVLFWFYAQVFKSKHIAVVASLIFLLNGGFGFIRYIEQVMESPTPVKTAVTPTEKYTHNEDENIRWISVIDSMILPQRAFNHGFPIALFALGLVYAHIEKIREKKSSQRSILVAGILLGILPIIHTHSVIAIAFIAPIWLVFSVLLQGSTQQFIKKTWLAILLAILLAAPLMVWLSGNAGSFLKLNVGWYGAEDSSWMSFWLKNWGLTPLLAATGWLLLIRQNTGKARLNAAGIFLPFFLIFAVANIVIFQPYAWDNTKLFAWASVGFSGLTAYMLAGLASQKKFRALGILLAIALFGVTVLSGSIDAYMIQRIETHKYMMYNSEELQLAEWVKTNTSPEAVWLTGDNHNHWLYNLTGRQPLMTFSAWLWTHGYEYTPMSADISNFFRQPSSNTVFLKKYNVSYAVIGPNERDSWHADEATFKRLFPVIKETTNYTLFDMRAQKQPKQ